MIEADDHHGVENNEKCDEIPGLRSIERAIEKSLAMTLKRIPVARSGGSESIVVAREWVDDSMGNSEHGKTTKLKENLNSNKARPDSTVIEGDFEVGNYQQNDLQGGREEIEIIIRKGSHVDCVGEISEGAGSVSGNRVQISQKTPKSRTLRDLMVLQDNDVDVTSFQSAIAVDNNQARNFCLNASPGIVYQNSTEEETPKVAEKLNLENQDSELEAYILDKLSLLQPSFRTLFEPSVVGASSTGSSDNKTGQEAGKSKWKKKIEDVVAKVTNLGSNKQLQSPDLESILYETDVKGILKKRWEEERKKGKVKQKTRWPRSCICCPLSNSSGRKMEEWEFQLEEYSSAW